MQVPRDFKVSSIAQVHHRMLINVMVFDGFGGLLVEWAPESAKFIRFYKGLVSGFSSGAKHCFANGFLGLFGRTLNAHLSASLPFSFQINLYLLSTSLGLRYMRK